VVIAGGRWVGDARYAEAVVVGATTGRDGGRRPMVAVGGEASAVGKEASCGVKTVTQPSSWCGPSDGGGTAMGTSGTRWWFVRRRK
jgi:hypothetical protein